MRKRWKWRSRYSRDDLLFPALRVRAEGPTTADQISVELNGMDITRGLTELSIRSAVGKPHRVAIHLLVDGLDVDLDALDDLQVESSLTRSES